MPRGLRENAPCEASCFGWSTPGKWGRKKVVVPVRSQADRLIISTRESLIVVLAVMIGAFNPRIA